MSTRQEAFWIGFFCGWWLAFGIAIIIMMIKVG